MATAAKAAPSLARRMANVMGEVKRLRKTGFNQHHRYEFATDADVSDLIRELLAQQGIEFGCEALKILDRRDMGKQQCLTVLYRMEFRCADTDEVRTRRWLAEAADTQDKALNKAATAAVKYFLLKNFLVSTGDPRDDADHGDEPQQATKRLQPAPDDSKKLAQVLEAIGGAKNDRELAAAAKLVSGLGATSTAKARTAWKQRQKEIKAS